MNKKDNGACTVRKLNRFWMKSYSIGVQVLRADGDAVGGGLHDAVALGAALTFSTGRVPHVEPGFGIYRNGLKFF